MMNINNDSNHKKINGIEIGTCILIICMFSPILINDWNSIPNVKDFFILIIFEGITQYYLTKINKK